MFLTLPKSMEKSLSNGKLTKEELTSFLLKNYSVFDLADALADYIAKDKPEEEVSPIALTREEFDRVFSLFRIKGERIVDGEIIKETRGRPAKLDVTKD